MYTYYKLKFMNIMYKWKYNFRHRFTNTNKRFTHHHTYAKVKMSSDLFHI